MNLRSVLRIDSILYLLMAMSLASSGVLYAQASETPATLESLFAKSLGSTEIQYAQFRSAILTRSDQADAFLQQKAKSGATEAEKTLAEILLSRLGHGEEFERLEQEFHEKVWNLKFTIDWVRHAPPNRNDIRFEGRCGLVTAEEFALWRIGLNTARQMVNRSPERIERISLSDSVYWKPFIEELLMKGWCPTGTISDPQRKPTIVLPPNEIQVELQDYILQAVVLAGKMKLQRTAGRLREMLQDQGSAVDIRACAAVSLGRLSHEQSLPVLLQIATMENIGNEANNLKESSNETELLTNAAFEGIVLGRFESAIPEMELALKDAEAIERRAGFDWGRAARNALRNLRETDAKKVWSVSNARHNVAFVTDAWHATPNSDVGVFLEATLNQSEYLLGEPLLICCQIVNGTKEPIRIPYDSSDPHQDSIMLEIRDSNGEVMKRLCHFSFDKFESPIDSMAPGQRLVQMINVFDDYPIMEPGTYDISAHFESDGTYLEHDKTGRETFTRTCWGGKLDCRVGQVEVIAPVQRDDQMALEILAAEAGRTIRSESPSRLSMIFFEEARMKQLLVAAPESRYAMYAKYYLALDELHRHELSHSPQFARSAMERLDQIRLDQCGQVFKGQVVYFQTESARRCGELTDQPATRR